MALGTFTELTTAIQYWLHREDASVDETVNRLDDFIAMAEAEFNRTLRLTGQITRANLTCSSRFTSLTTLTAPLLEIRSASLTTGGTRYRLDVVSPDQMQALNDTGIPTWYSRAGEELQLYPVPDASYTVELIYWRTIPALTSGSPTNFLLTLAPDVYLYRSLLEAGRYLVDDALIARVQPLYDRAVAQLMSDDMRKQFGGSSLQQRVM